MNNDFTVTASAGATTYDHQRTPKLSGRWSGEVVLREVEWGSSPAGRGRPAVRRRRWKEEREREEGKEEREGRREGVRSLHTSSC